MIRFKEKTLIEFFKNKYKYLEKQIYLDRKTQEQINYWLNSVEEKKIDVMGFQNLLTSQKEIEWFAVYLVYERIPFEDKNLQIYRKLIMRSNLKDLYYTIYKRSMKMINELIDYLLQKEVVHTSEINMQRSCGKWVAMITIYSNRPILLKDFDIKAKIYKAYEEQKLINIIPMFSTILLVVEKSTFFNIQVPYINSLFDLLREIMNSS